MGQIQDFFRSDFNTFFSKKKTLICPIWVHSAPLFGCYNAPALDVCVSGVPTATSRAATLTAKSTSGTGGAPNSTPSSRLMTTFASTSCGTHTRPAKWRPPAGTGWSSTGTECLKYRSGLSDMTSNQARLPQNGTNLGLFQTVFCSSCSWWAKMNRKLLLKSPIFVL